MSRPSPHAFTADHWAHLLVVARAAQSDRPLAPTALPEEGWRHVEHMRAAGWARTDPEHLPPEGLTHVRLTRLGRLVVDTLREFLSKGGTLDAFYVPQRVSTRTGEREHLESSPRWTLCGRRIDLDRTRRRERERIEGPKPYCRSCWLSHGRRLATLANELVEGEGGNPTYQDVRKAK